MGFNGTKTPLKPTGKAKYQVPKRRHPERGYMEYCLEGEVKEKFCKLFPIHSNRRMMEWFGISFATLQRFKRKLGLEKNMKAVRREQSRDTKRICEANGYYASLRGRTPSEATLEGTRRYRATHPHPLEILKQKNIRKYREFIKRRSESMRELRRIETLREKYGLERKTRFRCKTISPNGSAQKHLMIKLHNYFADADHVTWVCYDRQTRRSPRMEATAMRHGLRLVEGDE